MPCSLSVQQAYSSPQIGAALRLKDGTNAQGKVLAGINSKVHLVRRT